MLVHGNAVVSCCSATGWGQMGHAKMWSSWSSQQIVETTCVRSPAAPRQIQDQMAAFELLGWCVGSWVVHFIAGRAPMKRCSKLQSHPWITTRGLLLLKDCGGSHRHVVLLPSSCSSQQRICSAACNSRCDNSKLDAEKQPRSKEPREVASFKIQNRTGRNAQAGQNSTGKSPLA